MAPAAAPGKRFIPLDLKPALAYLRPDGQARIRLDGVPGGMQLTAGSSDGSDTWWLTAADLDELMVIAPADYGAHAPLAVTLLRRDPRGGPAESAARFDVLLTPGGATSAFSGLEPEDRDGGSDSIIRLRQSLGRGRGKLKVKSVKQPLDFGAAAAFDAQRSCAHLETLLGGRLADDDGIASEAGMTAAQRLDLARAMWEREAAARLAEARQQWDAERAALDLRVSELGDRLRQAGDEIKRLRDGREDWHSDVRARLIGVVARLNDEHAAELAQVERRLKREAEAALAAARIVWEREAGISAG
jgi:uncharacterized protein YukE